MVRNGVMGRQGSRIALAIGILLGLVTAALVFIYLSQQGEETSISSPLRPVVVAKDGIAAGTRLTADLLTVRQVPADLALAGSFQGVQPLVGQVTRFPTAAGEQVLNSDIASASVLPGVKSGDVPLSFIVPPGKRAMSVAVSEVIGAGGLIRPGDFVDVIGIFDVVFYGIKPDNPVSKEEVDKYLVTTVLQNVEVLAVAQQLEEVASIGGKEGKEGEQRLPLSRPKPDPKAATITLAVTPEEAQRLFMAEQRGRLKLTLRPFGELKEAPLEPLPAREFLPKNLPAPFPGGR